MKANAILKGLCPRCRKGHMFKSWMDVHERCPECNLLLKRESGYFLGAMYFEYGIAGLAMGLLTMFLRLLWPLSVGWAVMIALLIFAPFIPMTVRFSRTLWIYWDNAVDPQS